jgi:putative ABC transport system permease protein
VTARVVGVVGGNASLDEQVFLPLAEVQWLTDMPGGALEILVYGAGQERRCLRPIVEALRSAPALSHTEVSAWYQREPWRSVMGMMAGIQGFIQFFIIFLAALAIFNTMSMSVLERTSEIGVMRAMGMTRPRALGIFLVESIFIGVLGSTAGVALGSVGGWYLETYGVTLGEELVEQMGSSFPMQATVYADLSPSTIVTALLLGVAAAVIGAFLPALRASSIQPVLAMRARR